MGKYSFKAMFGSDITLKFWCVTYDEGEIDLIAPSRFTYKNYLRGVFILWLRCI